MKLTPLLGLVLTTFSLAACSESGTACESDDCSAPDAGAASATPDGSSALPGVAAPSAPPGTRPAYVGRTSLFRIDGCEELADSVRELAIRDMHSLADEFERVLTQPCTTGGTVDYGLSSGAVSGGLSGGTGPSEVSGTNNQLLGVDEADMVKSDGRYLYVASQGLLRVLEAWPAESTRELAKVRLAGTVKQLFLHDNKLVVYLSAAPPSSRNPFSAGACTYGHSCDFTGDGYPTRIVVLDVSVPAQPVQLREISLGGSLIAARRIGSTIHTVVGSGSGPLFPYPSLGVRFTCAADADAAEQARQAIARYRAEAELKIRSSDVTAQLPLLRDSAAPAADSCLNAYVADAGGAPSFSTLLSFDLSKVEPATTATIVSRPGAVYVSGESVYMAVREYNWLFAPRSQGVRQPESSVVHRFRVGADPALTRYEASGRIPGRTLNQFAMDEYQGHLRIATTTGQIGFGSPGATSVFNTLSVLQQVGAELQPVGLIDNIAPGEDIRSVRFLGARGYVVTFKKTDPLFVLALDDPRAPRILSELKVDGFSTYMHPLDDTHLLTIGYDASEQGAFALFQGVQLSIFDVGDPANPRLAHRTVIGTRGSSSAALTNHLAFTLFPQKKVLALPMTICESADPAMPSANANKAKFSGLMLFDVDASSGFRERGRVAHPTASGGYDDASCFNWWTNGNSVVQRSVIMDDYVYSIASDVVRVQSLNALGTDLVSLPLVANDCQAGSTTAHGSVVARSTLDGATSASDPCTCVCLDGSYECTAHSGERCPAL